MPLSPQHIELTLRNIDELFVVPELDPFLGQFQTMSGIEQLVGRLRMRRLVRPLLTTITIPQDHMSSEIEERSAAALRGYCTARIEQIDLEKERVSRQGVRELEFGILFLAVCLLASGSVEVMSWLPEFFQRFFSEGLIIVGWIALWHPVDLLLFERWALARDRSVYKSIYDMDMRFQVGA